MLDAVERDLLDAGLLDEHDHLERGEQGGGEEDDVAADAELAEQVAHVHGGERDGGVRALARAARGPDQLGVLEVDLHPRVAERVQPLERRRARVRAGAVPR